MKTLPLILLAVSLTLAADEHPAPAPKAKSPAKIAPAPPAHPAGPTEAGPATPKDALAELSAGNNRFVAGKRVRTLDTGHDAAMRAALVKGQAPFAVVITCSDSRVPDALLFDQEAGRLFTSARRATRRTCRAWPRRNTPSSTWAPRSSWSWATPAAAP